MQAVRDFLMQCFQKDPNLRVSARKLLKHPWIMNAKRADSVVRAPSTKYEEAVPLIEKWNEALNRVVRTDRSSSQNLTSRRPQDEISTPVRGPQNTQNKVSAQAFISPDHREYYNSPWIVKFFF